MLILRKEVIRDRDRGAGEGKVKTDDTRGEPAGVVDPARATNRLKEVFSAALIVVAMVALATPTIHAQQPGVLRIVVAPAETLHVTTWGTGEPLVIVPGIWSNTFAFRKVVSSLTENAFRVIIIEPLAVASSTRPPRADYSMSAQSRRIAAVLDSLQIDSAIFIGQALSTSMVMRLAVRSPQRVRGVVSLEGGVTDVSATPGLRRGLALAAILFRIIPVTGIMKSRIRRGLEDVSGDRSWITREIVEAYFAPWRRSIPAGLTAYRAMARSAEPDTLARELVGMRIPVHILIGSALHYGGVSAEELAPIESLPHSRITYVRGAGHLLHEEKPYEVAAAVLNLRSELAARR